MAKANKQLTHTPAPVSVFQTNDYDRFKMITGNRQLNMQKIKKIIADIESGTNLLQYNPILVAVRDGLLEIVDGQHRYVVAKKTGNPVYYIISEDLTLYQIAMINSNTEKWKTMDFINCYIEGRNEHYVKLNEFLKDYPGCAPTLACILLERGSANAHTENLLTRFQQGKFEVKEWDRAKRLLDKAKGFPLPQKFARHFVAAVQRINDAGLYDIDQLISLANKWPDELKSQTSTKKYLNNLEEIANKNKSKRVAIY